MDLVSRVKGILLAPAREWAVIDTEPATVASLFGGYAVPLIAFSVICRFIGLSVIGVNFLGTSFKIPMSDGLMGAVVTFVMMVIGIYALGMIIDAAAPSFGGQKGQIQAQKVAVYSATASWLSGVFLLVPALSFLTFLALYSLYLLYVGLPIVMKAPKDKALGYTVVVIVCMIIIMIVINAIAGALVPGSVPHLNALKP
jgi:hypothetical protein